MCVCECVIRKESPRDVLMAMQQAGDGKGEEMRSESAQSTIASAIRFAVTDCKAIVSLSILILPIRILTPIH